MKRLILIGSPRTQGRSAALGETLFEGHISERPDDELFLVPISEIDVGPCIGCDGCKEKSPIILKNDDGQEITVWRHRCVFDDDMQSIYDLIDDADEVTCVVPVYFSGTPAPFKCLLDRLQPYFWALQEEKGAKEAKEAKDAKDAKGAKDAKRPLTLHVVGEGNDPHGFKALISEVRSAFAVAGFSLDRVWDWVGKLSPDGQIQSEATEVPVKGGPDSHRSSRTPRDRKPGGAAGGSRKTKPQDGRNQGSRKGGKGSRRG